MGTWVSLRVLLCVFYFFFFFFFFFFFGSISHDDDRNELGVPRRGGGSSAPPPVGHAREAAAGALSDARIAARIAAGVRRKGRWWAPESNHERSRLRAVLSTQRLR